MMRNKKRWMAIGLAAVTASSLWMTACGGNETTVSDDSQTAAEETVADEDGQSADAADSDDTASENAAKETVILDADSDTTFTWMLSTGEDAKFYAEYEDGPVQKAWMDMAWDADGDGIAKKISVDFTQPASTADASEQVNILLATGEYPDVLDAYVVSQSLFQLYEEGVALDLTEYVEQYMPNYKAWITDHTGYDKKLTNEVDGERRYLQLYGVGDRVSDMWGGYMYRRDWIVDYGTNPQTGEAFTGGLGDDGIWEDDVVFPSGNTDPIYISDWEWMMEIFQKALDENNVTDGYCMNLYYMGDIPMGEFESGFGMGCSGVYLDENGVAQYGGISDGYRAYIDCMAAWYANGWIDPSFEERSGDIFFSIDSATLYSGKVGAWWGTTGQLGANLRSEEPMTANAFVFAAPQPINDVYGTSDEQGKVPNTFYTQPLVSGGIIITEKAKDKDLATLLSAIDWLYSEEGGLVRGIGWSDKEQEQLQNGFYLEHNVEGAYFAGTPGDKSTYVKNRALQEEEGLTTAVCAMRLPGLSVNIDEGYDANMRHNIDMWSLYENIGTITSEITNQLTADQSQETSLINSNIMTCRSQAVPDFITGRTDIHDDAAWEKFCQDQIDLGAQTYADIINEVLGN